MKNEISELIQEAINEKRNGNFELSLKYYLEAVDVDSTHKGIYNGLGKTAYLAGNTTLSVLAYLSYMHLEMNDLENQMSNNELPMPLEGVYNDLPENVKKNLPRKSAVLILSDVSMQKHMGHTITDEHPERPTELNGVIEIYRAQIQAKLDYNYNHLYDKYQLTLNSMKEIEDQFYLSKGMQVMLDLIQWDKLSNNNVIDIYFDEDNPVI